jgi:hypothetical protein
LPAGIRAEFCSLSPGPVRGVPLAESGKGVSPMGACEPSVVQIASDEHHVVR